MRKLLYTLTIAIILVLIVPFGVNAATNVSPSEGSASGQFNEDTAIKEYSVTLNSAGRLSIAITAGVNLDFRIYEGSPSLSSKYQFESIDKGSETLTYDLAAGNYTLQFESYNEGSFSFKTSFTSASETYTGENNTINAVRGGSSVPFNTNIKGQIAWNDDRDYYKVVLKKSGRLTMKVHSDIKEVGIYLYEPNENYTTVDPYMYKGDKTFKYDLIPGTYYIEFEGAQIDGITGTYGMKLSFTASGETYTRENNTINAVRNSSAVPLAKKVIGQLAHNDDCDYYKISIPAKGKYYLAVDSKLSDTSFALYNSKENIVKDTKYNSYNSHKKGSKTYYYNLKKGVYYLGFDKDYGSAPTGVYNFKVGAYIPKTTFKNVKRGKKKITVYWNKKSGVTGYQIQYGLKNNFKGAKTITIKKQNAASRKIGNLKAKKKYYTRVRTYKTVGGKNYYSKWSVKKSAVTK